MAPIYTITAADVSAVSTLTEGAIADWGAETITFPATIEQVTAQRLVNHARFFESTEVGLARPPILADTSGKTQIGVDPETLETITTGVVAVLENSWRVVTAKSSGGFIVRDIYRADGSVPYVDVAGVFIQYLTTIGGVISKTTSGSGLDAAQDTKLTELHSRLTPVRAAALDLLEDISDRILNIFKGLGREPGVSVTQSDPGDNAGDTGFVTTSDGAIDQVITRNPDGSVTVENRAP